MNGFSRPGIRAHRKTALFVMTAINALNYLDRFVSAPILPLIIASLSITDSQAGSLQSVFILTFALVSPLSGSLVDKIPRYHVAALGVLLWSAATLASGVAATFFWLLFARSLVGVGEASYTVVAPSLLSDHYPSQARARILAIFYAAIPVGSALGFILGGQVGASHGWRTAFFLAGAPGIVLGLLLFFLIEPRRGQLDAPRDPTKSTEGFFVMIRARKSYILNVVAQTIYTFTVGGLAAWMPTYLVRERHLGVGSAGMIFGGTLACAGLIGTLLGGHLGDRLAHRVRGAHFLFAGLALLASLPFTLVAILAPSPIFYWPATFFALLLLFVVTGPLNAALVNVLPARFRGRGVGTHTLTIHLLGDALSPFLIGLASDQIGLRIPILATGLYAGIAGIILIVGRRALSRDLENAMAG